MNEYIYIYVYMDETYELGYTLGRTIVEQTLVGINVGLLVVTVQR